MAVLGWIKSIMTTVITAILVFIFYKLSIAGVDGNIITQIIAGTIGRLFSFFFMLLAGASVVGNLFTAVQSPCRPLFLILFFANLGFYIYTLNILFNFI